jgi:hypothetical protein
MRRRNRLLATAALAFAIGVPATAQVTAGSLPQTDPWGVGWISANDGPLPTSIWNNTDEATLGPLFGALKPRELAPSARQALRRLMMSKAKGPGGITLIPERLRLLEELGETESAVDLRRRYREQDWGKDADMLSAEFNLAAGETDAACGAAGRQADAAWRSIRALCAAIAKDIGGANVLVEQIAASDDASGMWLLGALPAINAPELKKPDGRYATPFEAAVSVAAKLPVPANAFNGMRADVAAAIATNEDATPAQRRAALRVAIDGGKLKAADVAAVLALPADPAPQAARGAAARPDALTQALTAAADKEADAATQAAAYAAALKGAETLTDARIVSLGLHAAIKALPRNDDTLAYADAFARASLTAGDTAQASEWRKHLGSLAAEKQDAWAIARLDLMLNLAGAKTDKPTELLGRMIAAVQPAPDTKPGASSSSGEQQLAIRRIENTRVLFLHVGLGRDLTGEQRTLLSTVRTAGRGVPDAAIARITTAARQDADGEAALAAIAQLGGDVSALSFAGLSDLLTQLNAIGLGKDADAIALEAMQVWKAF